MKKVSVSHQSHRSITVLICVLAIITVSCGFLSSRSKIPTDSPSENEIVKSSVPTELPAGNEIVESPAPNDLPAVTETVLSPDNSKGFTSGVQSCIRDEKDQYSNDFPKGWKSFHCIRWIKANKSWTDYNGTLGTFQNWEITPISGNPMQLAPYQEGEGNHYVVTTSGVKYPVALNTDNTIVFPGVATTGRYFNTGWGSTDLITQTFWFLIPEAMNYKEIVYVPGDQHMILPELGETLALPEPDGDFETKFPASLNLDEFFSVEIQQPSIQIDDEDHLTLLIPFSVTNKDATANHSFQSKINVVDSNSITWDLYGASADFAPGQTENLTAKTVSSPISIDQLPDVFYIAIDGVDKDYYFKVDAKQLTTSKQ